jgi:hypothetical protein
MISNLGFNSDGILFGIFPDMSWSSGFWSSMDFGQSWENEFYSVNMNCVGFDVQGWIFTGWGEEPPIPQQGIALYDTGTGSLLFLNEGLSSLVINDICFNPSMSAMALFCCTGNGVYISYDYFMGIEKNGNVPLPGLNIFPNPADERVTITCSLPSNSYPLLLKILDMKGNVLREQRIDEPEGDLQVNCDQIPSGIFVVEVESGSSRQTGKMIVTHR